MKKILIFLLLSFDFYVHAQLLVVQKNNKGVLEPLSNQNIEKYNDEILNVLVHYTWPSCIAYDLSDDDKSKLLAPVQGAEQNFVRKKLQTINKNLDVIFLPTTLYELFYINSYLNEIKYKCEAKTAGEYLTNPEYIEQNIPNILEDIEDILNQDKSTVQQEIKNTGIKLSPVQYVKQQINELSQNCNEKLFDQNDAYGYLNVLNLHQKIFLSVSNQQTFKGILDIETFIFENSKDIKNMLIQNLITLQKKISKDSNIQKNYPLFYDWITHPSGESDIDDSDSLYSSRYGLTQIIEFLQQEENNHILQKAIDIEYEAEKTNKGLLLRGSDVIKPNGSLEIIGTTQRADVTLKNQGLFSMSFGVSLFAGAFFYIDAMAYAYLTEFGGYALFIDKFQYIDNYNSNLFLIPGLTIEMALFGVGVWFHPRSKPVTLDKSKHDAPIIGIVTGEEYTDIIKDPYGIFLVTRDPYRQAFLFSKFLVENGKMIGNLNIDSLQEDEKIGLNILKNQDRYTGEKALELLIKKYKQKNKQSKKLKTTSIAKLVDVLKALQSESGVKKDKKEENWVNKNNQKENSKTESIFKVVDVLKALRHATNFNK